MKTFDLSTLKHGYFTHRTWFKDMHKLFIQNIGGIDNVIEVKEIKDVDTGRILRYETMVPASYWNDGAGFNV